MSNIASEGTELSIPEDLGTAAAHKLLQQIYLGGCTDSASQSLALLFMALGQKDVSRIVLGSLTDYAIAFLQHLREFFGVTFKIQQNLLDEADESIVRGADKVNLTCVGIGYSNLNKRVI